MNETSAGTPSKLARFESPEKSLGLLDSASAANIVVAAADVTLVVDAAGIVRDAAFSGEDTTLAECRAWIGRPWVDTVTAETRPKIEALIKNAGSNTGRRWRQVNHTTAQGKDFPVLYTAVPLGDEGRLIAFGRDLRPTAVLQQRLVEAQLSMERDYWRLRQVETRYRLLFQMASEPVLIIDAVTMKVVEANPAVGKLLGSSGVSPVGRVFPEGFDADSSQAIRALLAKVQVAPVSEDIRVRLEDSDREFHISASAFRQDNASYFLVRLTLMQGAPVATGISAMALNLIEQGPDGFVVSDLRGVVLTANQAFVDLAQLSSAEQAKGQSLERWVGRSGIEFNVLVSNLRQHGSVKLFSTMLRGEHGAQSDVEISAVCVSHGEHPCIGLTIRDVGRRLTGEMRPSQTLPRSVDQLTQLVGRVSLKELIGETTDMIEKLCIEAALELTEDNRAAAAEMLGLSRQSLYVKLRRYGLGGLPADEEQAASRPN